MSSENVKGKLNIDSFFHFWNFEMNTLKNYDCDFVISPQKIYM